MSAENAVLLWVLAILAVVAWIALVIIGRILAACGRGVGRVVSKGRALVNAPKIARQREKLAQDQRFRDEERARLQALYAQHAPEIGPRFTAKQLRLFMREHMGDARSVEYVREQGRRLEALIRSHVNRVEPPVIVDNTRESARPDRQMAINQVRLFHEEHPEIHIEYPRRRLEMAIRVAIPPTATAEQAWTAAQQLLETLHGLTVNRRTTTQANDPGQTRIRQLEADLAQFDQQIEQLEQDIAAARSRNVNPAFQERELSRLRGQRQVLADELEAINS